MNNNARAYVVCALLFSVSEGCSPRSPQTTDQNQPQSQPAEDNWLLWATAPLLDDARPYAQDRQPYDVVLQLSDKARESLASSHNLSHLMDSAPTAKADGNRTYILINISEVVDGPDWILMYATWILTYPDGDSLGSSHYKIQFDKVDGRWEMTAVEMF